MCEERMDAAYEFALNGPNMDFALNRIHEVHLIPAGLFIDIMTEKLSINQQILAFCQRLSTDSSKYYQQQSLNPVP